MGLLSFLSKKSYPDLTERGSLKTSAYNATVASSPPIYGAYPVRGNGSKILEKFQRSHPNLAAVSHYNAPATSPIVAHRAGDNFHSSGEERPGTVSSSQSGKAASGSSLQSQSKPGLPPPQKKKFGPYRLPSKVVTDIQTSSTTAKPAPSPGLISLNSGLIWSGESSRSKGYVDLLDAQSMIKPSDFYGRIQAAGTRNYGEDVADRNIKDKSISYRTEISQERLPISADANWVSAITQHVDDHSTGDFSRRPRIHHSLSSGLRSSHTSADSFPKRTSSRLPPYGADEMSSQTASTSTERAARRKSMPSLAPESLRSSSTAWKGEEPDLFPESLRDRALAAMAHGRENTRPNISTKRQSLVMSHVEQPLHPKFNDLENPFPAPSYSSDQPRRKTISHLSALVESRSVVKRRSLTAMRTPSRGERYEDTYLRKASRRNTQLPGDHNSASRQLGSTTDLQEPFPNLPAHQLDTLSQMISPPAKSAFNRDSPSQLNHPRKQSLISLSSASIRAYEMETPVPERASSLSHWSVTSETAMSTLSSNPFRPQSGHTANTSVDFLPKSPLAAYHEQSIPPVPDLQFSKSSPSTAQNTSVTTSPTSPASPSLPRSRQSPEFYLEDYASSDGSSPSLSRGSFEEDLLFSDSGYGTSGAQISGLPGLFDAVVPASLADMPTSQVHGVPGLFHHMPVYPHSDSDYSLEDPGQTDSSDDELNFDIPLSRASSGLRDILPRQSFAARWPPVGEEDDL
ncbi:hypothetical protein F5Y14DRAFT_55089 [Nemania sp. NC0429]|nr:hypothetical protein F5Y14DRAFT_55089 [Nemania sp. NC0429]